MIFLAILAFAKNRSFRKPLSSLIALALLVWTCDPVWAFSFGPLRFPTVEQTAKESPKENLTAAGQAPSDASLAFQPISDVAINAGNLVTFQLKADSPRGLPVHFTSGELPKGASLVESEFRWQPGDKTIGNHTLEFSATDGEKTVTQTVQFFFVPAPEGPANMGVLSQTQPSELRSAMILPGDKGWIVVIPTTIKKDSSQKDTEHLREDEKKGDGEFRIGESGDLSTGGQGNSGDAPILVYNPFFTGSFPGTKPSTKPSDDGNDGTGGADDDSGGSSPESGAGSRFFGNIPPPVVAAAPGFSPFHNTFTDATASVGLGNTFGRGIAFDDVDKNGELDFYVASPYRPLEDSFFIQFEPDPVERNVLFLGQRVGQTLTYSDQTGSLSAEIVPLSNPDIELEKPQSVLFGDFNNDGDRDIFMANFNRGNVLLENQGSGQPFVNRSVLAGVNQSGEAHASVTADFNLDGRLDIFVANGADGNKLYINQGGGVFQDQAQALGFLTGGNSVGVVAFDADEDGDSDIYVLNWNSANQFFKNNILPSGAGSLSFTEVGASAGVNVSGFSAGVEVGDLDNDGRLDLLVAMLSASGSKLFRNTSTGSGISFSDQTAALTSALVSTGSIPAAVGGAFLDIHNDGMLDVYVITENAPNLMFRNNGNFSFAEVTEAEVVFKPDFADSVATMDYDQDGLTDIFIAATPSLLYRNITVNENRWLKIDLTPVSNLINKDALGALVIVERPDGKILTQEVSGGTGRSQDSRTLHFGMGPGSLTMEAVSIEVIWPTHPPRSSLLLSSSSDLTVNQKIVISDSGSPFFVQTPAEPVPAGRGLEDSFEIRVSDPDGDDVQLTALFQNASLFESSSLIQTGVDSNTQTEIWTFTFKPNALPNSETDTSITFTASDGSGAPNVSTEIGLHIYSSAQFNIGPQFESDLPDAAVVVEGAALGAIPVVAQDLDLYEAGILNASIEINPLPVVGAGPLLVGSNAAPVLSASGKSKIMSLEWTPAVGSARVDPYTVTIEISDGIETTEHTILITVLPIDIEIIPPLWIDGAFSVGEVTAGGGNFFALNLLRDTGNDGSLDFVNYTGASSDLVFGIGNLNGRNASIVNGVFNYTPELSEEGDQVFTLTVHDTITPDVVDSVSLTVHVAIPPPAATLFKDMTTDVTAGQGLGYFADGALPASAVAAVIGDYDGDANGVPARSGAANTLEDLFVLAGNGSANQLFRLAGASGPFQDMTEAAGLPQAAGDSRSAILADFNKDGIKDIFVVNAGGDQLFLGNGNGTFAPDSALASGIDDSAIGNGALVGDVNNDGLLDLYVLNNGSNILYLNRFDGATLTFENVSVSTGTVGSDTADSVAGLFFDPDGDGDLDLFVANGNAPHNLFLNPGPPLVPGDPFVFSDVAEQVSLANAAENVRALKTADVDGDADLDLLLLSSNSTQVKLLLHDQDHPVSIDNVNVPSFEAVGNSGLNPADDLTLSLAEIRDAVFIDFDNDTDADAVVGASNSEDSEYLLYENDGTGHFSLHADTGLSGSNRIIRSLTSADINQDGRLDLLSIGSASQLFLNQIVNGNAYLQIVLQGVVSNHLGLNSLVLVNPHGDDPSLSAVLNAGTGRGQESSVLHFGLGNLGERPVIVDHVIAAWPRGTVTFIENDVQNGPFLSDQRLIISELQSDESVSMNITLEHNLDQQAPSPGFENVLQLVDIPVDEGGHVIDGGGGVVNGLVPARQYVKIDFSLPDTIPANITLFTDNLNGDPAYLGQDHEQAAGFVGTADHTTVVPLLWKVFNASDIPNLTEPGSFIGDAGGFEGLMQDRAQSGFGDLVSVITREVVSNVNGGTLGLYPPDQVATRVLDPARNIRVYIAADFSSPPGGGTWPPQDYNSSRITFELNVDGV